MTVPFHQQRCHAQIPVSVQTIPQHGNSRQQVSQRSPASCGSGTGVYTLSPGPYRSVRHRRSQSSADTTAIVFRCRRFLSGMVFVLLIRQKLLCGRGRCFLQGHLHYLLGAAGVGSLHPIRGGFSNSLHAYADDNQLYIHCQPEDAQSAVLSGVQQCVSIIEQWMAAS